MKKLSEKYLEKLKLRKIKSLNHEDIVAQAIERCVGVVCDPELLRISGGVLYVARLPVLLRTEIKIKKQAILRELSEQGFVVRDII